MRLDRNLNGTGLGKYGLVNNRLLTGTGLTEENRKKAQDAIAMLWSLGLIEWGEPGSENEFFVIKLKDKFAASGLYGYANAAYRDDPEYADDVFDLAKRAGPVHPNCKGPD